MNRKANTFDRLNCARGRPVRQLRLKLVRSDFSNLDPGFKIVQHGHCSAFDDIDTQRGDAAAEAGAVTESTAELDESRRSSATTIMREPTHEECVYGSTALEHIQGELYNKDEAFDRPAELAFSRGE